MRVVVLMSAYQGERFIVEQLKSILAQLPEDGTIVVRDDGSTDSTVARVESLGSDRISLIRGENLGFCRSFLHLIQGTREDADLIMLADQDDIWLPDKIQRAAEYLMRREGIPLLYCSRLRLVDIDLKPIGYSPACPRGPSFQNALGENIVIGCTAAFNREALRLVRRADPAVLYFHDWWLYLVVSAFGDVYFDEEPSILYRQHSGNAIGMGSGLRTTLTKLRKLRQSNWVYGLFSQVECFREVFADDLAGQRKRLIDRFFDCRKRSAILRLLFSPVRFRQRLTDDFLFRGLLAYFIVSGRGLIRTPMSPSKS